MGWHCRFIEPAIDPAVRADHQFAPILLEWHRRIGRDIPFARSVQVTEHADSGNGAGASPPGFEFQRLDQRRGELSQRRVAVGSHHEWIHADSFSECFDFMPGPEQRRPTNGLIDHLDRIRIVVESSGKGVDCAAKQPHQSGNILRRGRVTAGLRVLGPAECRADQLVGHFDRGVGEPFFEVDQTSNQCRPSARCRIALDQVSRGRTPLADELPVPVGMHGSAETCRNSDLFDLVQAVENVANVVGFTAVGIALSRVSVVMPFSGSVMRSASSASSCSGRRPDRRA